MIAYTPRQYACGVSNTHCNTQVLPSHTLLQGARVVRHLMIKQVQLYWRSYSEPGPFQEAPLSRDLLLRPWDCMLRLAMGPIASTSSSASTSAAVGACPLEVLLGTQLLDLQVRYGFMGNM